MKGVAASMLIAAAVVFVIARAMEDTRPWLGYVRATAEAAMVGAFADWFAVTALFRHPLGLPIPHTAIIQARKDQIGASLGGFVRDNFLTAEVVKERLEHAELAGRIGDWLVQPANAKAVSAQSAAVVAGVTEVLEDDLVQGGIEQVLHTRARSVPVAPLLGRVVEVAIEGNHHHVLLDAVLNGLGRFMEENRDPFRNRLYDESPWWVPEPVDDRVFEKIYEVVQNFLHDLSTNRQHEMRADIDARTAKLAADLKTSPEMLARGEELKEQVLAHPEVRAWSSSLWTRIKEALVDATNDPNSELRLRLDDALLEAGRSLREDPELRAKIDGWIVDATTYVAEQFRGEVADLIATTVQRWDTEETAERLELQVGRDLQFIRINGTLVGGLVGLTIYTLSELIF
jgi:uncharacterized membrane-anchored protein YjiN (DUF445 family)